MSDQKLNVNFTTYHKDTNSLSANGSDLWAKGYNFGPGRNITVKSHKTGNEIEFKPVKTIYHYSGEDVMGWVYKPVNANAPISKLTIWND